jgi:hypothetical protein
MSCSAWRKVQQTTRRRRVREGLRAAVTTVKIVTSTGDAVVPMPPIKR